MVTIRAEKGEDAASIRRVNDEAFVQEKESKLIEKLRNRGMLTISLVAILNCEVVGHIAFSPVAVESESSNLAAMTLAPLAVLPKYQRQGIGLQLVRAGLDECRRLGYGAVFVVGHPEYYPRFGFAQAKAKGIDCEFEAPQEAWMVLEFRDGALAGVSGTVKFQPEFQEAVKNS